MVRDVLTPEGSALTAGFLLAVVFVVAAYDLWVLTAHGPDATISRVLRRTAEAWPLLPYLAAFAGGLLFGHIFL